MTMMIYLLIFLAIFSSYGGSASNNTLQLPLTINRLLQDAIQRDALTDALMQLNRTFFEHVTFSDIVKKLDYKPLPQLKKTLQGVIVLGLAAIAHDLTVDKFLQPSKWTIIMSVEELANVSNNITLPLNDQVRLITIQEAMFKILEKRFNFKTEEIAEHLNTTKDEVYAFLEPGWIKVVNFITEKNVLELSRNYTIPLFYIAEALNMSLPGLYNSTLPQLEDILVNKIDIIKEAAERWKRIISSSIAGLLRVSSTVFNTVMSTRLPTNSTVSTVMEQITTMVIQPSFTSQTEMKTSSIFAGISSIQEMMYTSNKVSTVMLESSPTIAHQSTSMPDLISSNALTIGVQTAMSSFTNMESSSVPEMQTSALTPTETEPITSMHHTSVSMTTTQVPQSERSSTLQTEMLSSYMSMSQPTTTELTLPMSTEMVPTITSKSSVISESSKVEMVSSKSSPPDLLETTSEIMKISSTQHITTIKIPPPTQTQTQTQTMDKSSMHVTNTEILPTSSVLPQSSSTTITSSNTMDVSASQDITKSIAINAQTPSLSITVSSSDMSTYSTSETVSIDAMKSSSVAEITSIITTSFVLVTSSYGKLSTESPKPAPSANGKISSSTPKLPTSSQLTMTTQYPSDITTSSQFPKHTQTSSSQAHSSHFVLSTSATTREISTNLRYQQSTNTPESPPRSTSTADGLVIPVKSSLYHATSSSSHEQATAIPTTPVVGNTSNARSEDDIDAVVLIVIPIMCVLFLAAIVLAFVMWIRHRRRQKSADKKNGENGSELSRRGLVESLENINNNQATGFSNRGADDRSSRSMSRTSSVSNLETIQEGNEPEVPEIYDL